MYRRAILLLIASFAGLSMTTADESPTTAEARPDLTIEQLVNQTRESVVSVTVEGRDGRQAGMGTGFVISADGLIATNLHVIGEARPVRIRFHNGRQLPVTEVFASDRQFDLAIVRVAAKELQPLTLSAQENVPQGTAVIALGNPMGLRHSVVTGIVSGNREIDGRSMIQLAMPIEPGNSGGPLLDHQQNVLGIVTMKSAVTANLGFAIRVSELKSLLNSPNPVPMDRWKTIGSLNPRDWTTLFGASWQKRGGRIFVTQAGDSFGGRSLCLSNRELPAEKYEIGAFVRLDDETGAAGLAFGSDGQQRHYGFYPSGGRLRLTRFDGPTVYSWQVLEELQTDHYRPGRWNHLKVRIDDHRLECFVNDERVIERRLPELSGERVGLVKFRQTAANFKQFELLAKIAPTQLSDQRREETQRRIDKLNVGPSIKSSEVDTLSQDTAASLTVLQERAAELEQQAYRLKQLANDVHVYEVCKQLRQVFDSNEEVNLIRAALLISRLDNRDLDVAAYEKEFQQLAQDAVDELPSEATKSDRLKALNECLFRQNGFHGSRTNYYHAANSYFDRVLDDREGLPITLSLLYMEMGRQLGLRIEGVGLPGHFIVRYTPEKGEVQLIDVFNAGETLSEADARRMSTRINGGPFRAEYLDASPPQAIIIRMLHNLNRIAQRDGDRDAMLRYLEAMVAVDPLDPSHRGLRAILRQETGRKHAAQEDLAWFLEHKPAGVDLDQIQKMKDAFSE